MSLVLSRRETDYLLGTRLKRYRPNFFRQILRVTSEAPPWAERLEIVKIEQFASVKPSVLARGTPPKPSVSRGQLFQGIVEYQAGYDINDQEIARCRALGTDLDITSAVANQQAFETKFEEIASGAETELSLPGLGNISGANAVTATATWDDDLEPEAILQDLHRLVFAVTEGSLQNCNADTVALPLAKFHYIARTRLSDGTNHTILTAFREQSPYVKRVIAWNRFATLGANGVTRACAFDSVSDLGPRMVIPQEVTDHTPVRKTGTSVEVTQTVRVVGVMTENEKSVAYMDSI